MPFWRSYAHLIWTTKGRQPWITPSVEPQLYAHMVDSVAKIGCYVYAVNGLPDHVHVVLAIPPKHSVAYVVQMLKGSTAHFINHVLRPDEYHFQWQRGYGYLTLGQTQLERAVAYVEKQKDHHAQNTTNRWLERTGEEDGSPDGDQSQTPEHIIREAGVTYETEMGWKF